MTLLEALKEIRKNGPENKQAGICCNADMLAWKHGRDYDCCEYVCQVVEDWEHFSGKHAYPVPSTHDKYGPIHFYHNGYHAGPYSKFNLWRGQQRKYRLSLLDFLINKLEEGE